MRCPVCRAENTEATCRRCRADLTLLANLEQERARLIQAATQATVYGDGARVAALASAADDLRHGEDARSLLAVGHLLSRDFSAAFRAARSLTSTRS